MKQTPKIKRLHLLTDDGFKKFLRIVNPKTHSNQFSDNNAVNQLMENKNKLREKLLRKQQNSPNKNLKMFKNNEKKNISPKIETREMGIQKDFFEENSVDVFQPAANSSFFSQKHDDNDDEEYYDDDNDGENLMVMNEVPKNQFVQDDLYANIPMKSRKEIQQEQNETLDLSQEQREFLANMEQQGLKDVREVEISGMDTSKDFVNVRRVGNTSTHLVEKPSAISKIKNRLTRNQRDKVRKSLNNKNKKFLDFKSSWEMYEAFRRAKK